MPVQLISVRVWIDRPPVRITSAGVAEASLVSGRNSRPSSISGVLALIGRNSSKNCRSRSARGARIADQTSATDPTKAAGRTHGIALKRAARQASEATP